MNNLKTKKVEINAIESQIEFLTGQIKKHTFKKNDKKVLDLLNRKLILEELLINTIISIETNICYLESF